MLTIDVDRYRKLPFDVRSEFDEWLRAEKLDNEHAIFLALGEGTVTIEHHELVEVRPGAYRATRGPNGRVKTARKTVLVSTMPPLDAMRVHRFQHGQDHGGSCAVCGCDDWSHDVRCTCCGMDCFASDGGEHEGSRR